MSMEALKVSPHQRCVPRRPSSRSSPMASRGRRIQPRPSPVRSEHRCRGRDRVGASRASISLFPMPTFARHRQSLRMRPSVSAAARTSKALKFVQLYGFDTDDLGLDRLGDHRCVQCGRSCAQRKNARCLPISTWAIKAFISEEEGMRRSRRKQTTTMPAARKPPMPRVTGYHPLSCRSDRWSRRRRSRSASISASRKRAIPVRRTPRSRPISITRSP